MDGQAVDCFVVFSQWVEEQRRMCEALGLSAEAWLQLLEGAAERRAGLMAAVVGASVAAGLGMKPASGVDPKALLGLARQLLDAPKLSHPVLAAAARAGAPSPGRGAARLKARLNRKQPVETPARAKSQPAKSDLRPTPDAPGGGG